MSYHLRLQKAISYSGVIEATRQQPDVFVEEEEIANAALESGYFQLIEEAEKGIEKKQEKVSGKRLEEMTIPELETFAAYHNVSLKGVSKKADMIAKLRAELEEEETENEVDYGSPIMTELQKE